jgi:hypothetical protein
MDRDEGVMVVRFVEIHVDGLRSPVSGGRQTFKFF